MLWKSFVIATILLLAARLVVMQKKKIVKPRYRKPMVEYPRDTQFWATDFFVRGCKTFLEKCPIAYKSQLICARSYNSDFRNFANYCEMQYENCNSWRNWHVYKRQKC